ncbi:MAG: AI-2E family transporter [Clostridia bacterium]|nr:AI-2E family transporter [Clostridia bacterium]
MFKNFKKNDKYFTIALYAFVVVALLIALIFAFINLDKINAAIGGFFKAIASFIYGLLIAYICNPLYKNIRKYVFKFVEKKKPRPTLRKVLSLILTYIIFFAIVTVILFSVIPSIVENINTLVGYFSPENIQTWFDNIISKLTETFPDLDSGVLYSTIKSFLFNADGSLKFDISTIAGTTANFVLDLVISLVDQVFAIIVGIILSVYFLIHAGSISARIKKLLAAMFSREHFDKIMDFAKFSNKTFGRYLIGTICDSMVVGLVVGIILAILQMPYAVLIGVIVGVTNVIPFFGPFIGAIPSAFIILIASGEFWRVLVFVLVIVIVQQIDGNIFAPHIVGASIGLTPIGVIAAVTICSHFFGFLGMLIGVPLSAVLTYLVSNMINKRLKTKNLPENTDLYRKPNFFDDEEFIQASFDVEAQARIDMRVAAERARENLELHQIGIHEAQERIVNEREQVVIDAETSPSEAYVSTSEIEVPQPTLPDENQGDEDSEN